jgi:hypothetical protein
MLRWYQNGWKKWFSCLFSSAVIMHFADGRHNRSHKGKGCTPPPSSSHILLYICFCFFIIKSCFETMWSRAIQYNAFSSKWPRYSKFLIYVLSVSPYTQHMQSATSSVILLIFISNKRRVWDSACTEHAQSGTLQTLSLTQSEDT